jgi:hypothetical protein
MSEQRINAHSFPAWAPTTEAHYLCIHERFINKDGAMRLELHAWLALLTQISRSIRIIARVRSDAIRFF